MSKVTENAPDAGYKPQWRDTVEYIEDITYKIWENRDLDYIRDTYSDTCPAFVLSGCVAGAETVINGTKATLEMFPDRTLFPEDVLWNGRNEDDTVDENCSHTNVSGYHSSHLIRTTMTFDPVKSLVSGNSDIPEESRGKRGQIWVIAHCIMRDGFIVKEWLVRENEYLFQQLGADVDRVAEQWAKKWQTEDLSHLSWMKSEYQRVQNLAKKDQIMKLNLDNIFPTDHRSMYNQLCMNILEKYVKVWGAVDNKENFSRNLKKLYHPHARFESPQGNQNLVVGHADMQYNFKSFVLANGKEIAMVIDWAIMKPGDGNRKYAGENQKPTNAWRYPCEADVEMHQNFVRDFKDGCEAAETFTISARWTIVGKQQKNNAPHSYVPVNVMGESYLRCAGFRIIHEIMVYDNVAAKAQLHL